MRKIKTENKLLTFALHKTYFDRGYGISSIVKYFVGLMGLAGTIIEKDMNFLIFSAIGYVVFCYFLGMIWIKFYVADAENEIGNRINPFMIEMRRDVSNILKILEKKK